MSKRTNQTAARVMKLAHSIKTQFATFALALKAAWVQIKQHQIAKLVGSEKQIEWAEKIRVEKLDILNNVQKMPYMQQEAFFSTSHFYKILPMDLKIELRDSDNKIETALSFDAIKKGLENLKNNTSAKFWIENRDLKISMLISMSI